MYVSGLPSSPPYGDGDHPGSGPNGSPGNRQIPLTATFVGKSQSMNPKTIFVITLSAVVLLVVCLAAISVFLKYRRVGRSSNAVGPVFTTPSSKRRGKSIYIHNTFHFLSLTLIITVSYQYHDNYLVKSRTWSNVIR